MASLDNAKTALYDAIVKVANTAQASAEKNDVATTLQWSEAAVELARAHSLLES